MECPSMEADTCNLSTQEAAGSLSSRLALST